MVTLRRRSTKSSLCLCFITVFAFITLLILIVHQDNGKLHTVGERTRLLLTDVMHTAVQPPKARTYNIVQPVQISGIHVYQDSPRDEGLTPKEANFPTRFQHFVQLSENRRSLMLNNEVYLITGFNNYYMQTRAAWIEFGRYQVNEVFASAKKLGLNVLRCWAFSDGDEWNALQPQQGVLDEAFFRDGLDYVVTEARKHNIHLILTLTNGQAEYGGMEQYVKWAGKDSISEFYSNPQIKSAFKDYLFAIVNRVNTIDKVAYRNNPTILGWDLANEPEDPGFPGSPLLQNWIEEMSSYLKELDPNHLVMIGWVGSFGPSTPKKTKFNRYLYAPIPFTDRVYRMDDVCRGADFYKNHLPKSIDLAVAHLYPDSWIACDEQCKTHFSKNWIREHLKIAHALKRPFLLGEFGKQRPVAYRNAFLKMVYTELVEARRLGYPVAGSLLWLLADSEFPDYDGFTIYENEEAVLKARPSFPELDLQYIQERNKMRNRDAMVECLLSREQDSELQTGKVWNDGWQDTISLISNNTTVI